MYSPSDIVILVGGIIPVGGFIDGTFLEISKDIAPFSSKRTPDGTTHRLYSKDSNYTIKFTLAQSSSTNDKLGRIQQLDEITKSANFPLLIKDSKGNSKFFSPVAWIDGLPTQSFGQGIEGRSWSLKATKCVSIIGGNDKSNDFETLVDTILAGASTYGGIIGGVI